MGGLVAMQLLSLTEKMFKSVTLFNCQYPLFVGSALLEGSSRNLDGAADFLTKYGIHKHPEIEKPKKGFSDLFGLQELMLLLDNMDYPTLN